MGQCNGCGSVRNDVNSTHTWDLVITQAYLLKMLITHNENLKPLLNLLINCISDKSAPQVLSLNTECTFLFFLIF